MTCPNCGSFSVSGGDCWKCLPGSSSDVITADLITGPELMWCGPEPEPGDDAILTSADPGRAA